MVLINGQVNRSDMGMLGNQKIKFGTIMTVSESWIHGSFQPDGMQSLVLDLGFRKYLKKFYDQRRINLQVK